jgi:tryptophanyl-tRNA synthetase
VKRNDPGRPEVCNVFTLHGHFTDAATIERISGECRAGEIGCVDCKKLLAESIADHFAPMRERAAHYRERPDEIRDILDDGARRAREIARETIAEVREMMGLDWRSAVAQRTLQG